MKAALHAFAAIGFLLGAYGLVDIIERDAEDRHSYRRWVADACIPARAGQAVVAEHDGRRLSCTIYSDYARGLAPVIVSAAVMDVPR